MSARIIVVCLLLLSAGQVFSQTETVIPPSNRSTASLEKNMLFYADKRFTVTQSGSVSLPLNYLFDGNMTPVYSNPVDPVNPYVILIEGLPDVHSQAGAWIGWSTRVYQPNKFKVEAYNIYNDANTWVTIANETSYSPNSIMIPVPGLSVGKIRFTFYNGTGPNNEIGLSELFYIHPEGAVAYDQIMVKYNREGNVGIGTGDPTSTLDVKGNVNLNNQHGITPGYLNPGYYVYKDATTSYGMKLQYKDGKFGTMIFGPNQDDRFIGFGKVGTAMDDVHMLEHMRIDLNNGNVGIGTTDPLAKLHINGVLRWGDPSTYTYSGEDSGGGYLEHIGVNSTTSTLRIQTVKPGTQQYAVFRSNPYTGFSFNSDQGGNANVGIGIDNPVAPLHIKGGLPMTGSWNQTAILEATYPVQLFNSNNTRFAGIGYDFSSGMAIWVNSPSADVTGTGIPALSVRNNGNVGVGVYAADEKLTVNGKIHAKEIRVDATGLPDYVFEADYPLKTLAETEAFIRKYKHLPEVPSAAEVEKNGFELGEMNKLLLKKIEELTLHLIQLKKELELVKSSSVKK